MGTPGIPTYITNPDEAGNLAARLTSADRREPLVLVSIPKGQKEPHYDCDDLAHRLLYKADVIVITAPVSHALQGRLPERCAPWSGAAQVYQPGDTWVKRGQVPRFFVAYSQDEARDNFDSIVTEALKFTPAARAARAHAAPAAIAATDGGLRVIQTAAGVDDLIGALADPARSQPIVVISTAPRSSEPLIDATRVASDTEGLAVVYLLPTGPLSYRFGDAIGTMQSVYGGAGRVYAVGNAWLRDPYDSVLRLVATPGQAEAATDGLISDVLRQTRARQTSRTTATRAAAGVIGAYAGESRALVSLDDGAFAAIWTDLIEPDIAPQRLVATGMRVHGQLGDSGRLDVAEMRRDPALALLSYAEGAVVLARVAEVTSDAATLCLYPGVTTTVAAAQVTDNDRDILTSLLSLGEVVAARIVSTGPQWALTLLDIDDDEPILEAPAVLEGGPPWLEAPPDAEVIDAPRVSVAERPEQAGAAVAQQIVIPPTVSPDEGAQVPATDGALQAAERENARLMATIGDLQSRIDHLQRAQEQLRTQVRKARSKSKVSADADWLQGLFTTPEAQLRWDIERMWTERIIAAEKAALPLPAYDIGPDFIASLDAIEGITRKKVLEVLVDLLVGRELDDSHECKPPTVKQGVIRHDGARIWRVPLQVKTPSARRLHYWKIPGGRIELSRVALHDDFTP